MYQQSQTATSSRVLDKFKKRAAVEIIWKTDATATDLQDGLDDMHKRHDVQRQHIIDSVRVLDSFNSDVLTAIY